MKKNFIFVCMFAVLSSCSQSFIDLIPTSTVTIDVIYKNDKDFSDALIGVYNPIRSAYNDFWIFSDLRADDSWIEYPKADSWSYSDLFTLNSGHGLVNDAWTRYYQAIFRANVILAKLEGFDESTIPNKRRYIAEASFLRALCYFDLVRIFGDVPAVTADISIQEAYQTSRTPVATIYNNIIIPDLLTAEAGLLARYTGNEIGKPTTGAAKAILGRVYLTIKDFQKAENKLLEVTTMGYELEKEYSTLWDYSNKRNSEYIFNIEYESGVNGGSSFNNSFMPNFPEMMAFFGIAGTGGERYNPSRKFMPLWEEHDKRKEISIGIPGGYYNAVEEFRPLPVFTCQSYTQKYIAPSTSAGDSPADWKVIRYADVILMIAEAMNENGKTTQAIPYLNMIRTRAGVNEYPTTMSKEETFNAIELERRFELCFEGHRWFDLVRWGKSYEVMQSEGMMPHMVLYPIPLSQIQLIDDPAILPQNPGY